MIRKAVIAIVFQHNKYLIVNKTKINTNEGKEDMFLIEFFGDSSKLVPLDNEICTMKFLEKEELLKSLTHSETKTFFKKVFS